MSVGRIVIIPFLHGKLTDEGTLVEPDIEAIFERWLERHPAFEGPQWGYRVICARMHLPQGVPTDLVRLTADYSPKLADYDPAVDADLYEEFLAQSDESPPPAPHKIWVEQCAAAYAIEDEFGTQKALDYLVGEKFINFLAAAENHGEFRDEIPRFVAEIKQLFERWQLAQYLEVARESEPFDASLFEKQNGEDEEEFDPEEIEMLRQDDIRCCAADLLLVERAREWLLEEN